MKILTGSYPLLRPSEPEIYNTALVSAFLPYPFEIGEPAVLEVVRTHKFAPTAADLTETLDALMRPIRERDRRIAEHKARQAQIEDQRDYEARTKRAPEQRERVSRIVADLTAKLTPPGSEKRRDRPTPRYLRVTDEMREKAFKSLQAGRV